MLKRNIALALAALLAVGNVGALGACTPLPDEDESSPVSDTNKPSQSIPPSPDDQDDYESDTTRFDYFEEDVLAYATIDRSAYDTATFILPADLDVTDRDVEEYVRYAQYTKKQAVNGTQQVTDQPLSWGDDAYVYYRVLLDGQEIASASYMDADEPTKLGLGSRSLTVLEEKLIGVVPANTSRENPATFTITFPSNYGVGSLAGKEAEAQVYVAYAIQHTLPQVTRSFIVDELLYEPQKSFYASDQALVDEFLDYVREYLMESNQSAVNVAKQELVWDKLLSVATFSSLPAGEVNYYYNQRLARIKESHETRKTEFPTLDDFAPAYMGLPVGADWRAALREGVERQVKIEILTFAIAKTEGLDTVSEEELQREIDLWVDYYATQTNVPVSDSEVKQNVGLPALYRQAISYKVQTFLLDRMYFMYGEE